MDILVFFFIFLGQHQADEAAYRNPLYNPLFLLNYSFLQAVTGEQIDCALPLILWLSCHFEVGDQNQDATQEWQWSALTYQKLQERSLKRPSATHTLSHPVDPVLLHSGGKHSDGIIHSQAKILSWSMEPSAVKFIVATSDPSVYNVASLSCANWHFAVHKSPKKISKQPQSLRFS